MWALGWGLRGLHNQSTLLGRRGQGGKGRGDRDEEWDKSTKWTGAWREVGLAVKSTKWTGAWREVGLAVIGVRGPRLHAAWATKAGWRMRKE